MDLLLLATLKEKLIHAKKFSDVWKYFLDHFGEDPAFFPLGERTRHDVIESLIIQTAEKMFHMKVKADQVLLTLLPEQQFIHGGCMQAGHMINAIYFDDIFMGMIMVCSLGSDQTTTLRFTGRKVPDQTKPSMN